MAEAELMNKPKGREGGGILNFDFSSLKQASL
jgi:hypothetical protein